jgi:hypothetical protein
LREGPLLHGDREGRLNLEIDRFRYDAFISYSRRNMAFAVQLQKALERYRLPRLAGKVRRRLRIFRDQSDLIGADYFDSIDAALTESAKLILVCSPEAARSTYVNDEVRRFIERRGADNIIPLLLNGLPNNEVSPEQEDGKAFPPALCEALEMPLAIDYRGIESDDSKLHRGRFRHAWFSMLAGTLDVSREEIEERDRVRRRRQLAVIGTIAAGIIVALSVLTIYALVQRGIAEWQRGRAEDRAAACGRRTDHYGLGAQRLVSRGTACALSPSGSRRLGARAVGRPWPWRSPLEASSLALSRARDTVPSTLLPEGVGPARLACPHADSSWVHDARCWGD